MAQYVFVTCIFYRSNCKEPGMAGITRACKQAAYRFNRAL